MFANITRQCLIEVTIFAGSVTAILSCVLLVRNKIYRPSAEWVQTHARLITETHAEQFGNGRGTQSQRIDRIMDGVDELSAAQAITHEAVAILRARQDRFLDTQPTAYVICDSEGRNVAVTQAYANALGVEKRDLLGYGWANHIDQAERDRLENEYRLGFHEKRSFEFDAAMKKKDGSVVQWRCYACPVIGTSDRFCVELREVNGVRKGADV